MYGMITEVKVLACCLMVWIRYVFLSQVHFLLIFLLFWGFPVCDVSLTHKIVAQLSMDYIMTISFCLHSWIGCLAQPGEYPLLK